MLYHGHGPSANLNSGCVGTSIIWHYPSPKAHKSPKNWDPITTEYHGHMLIIIANPSVLCGQDMALPFRRDCGQDSSVASEARLTGCEAQLPTSKFYEVSVTLFISLVGRQAGVPDRLMGILALLLPYAEAWATSLTSLSLL